MLALGVATGAAAQSAHRDQTVLPVWNNASGKIEALLVLEPVEGAQAGARWRFGNNTIDATLGLDAGDSLALLCDRKNGLAGTLGNLSNNCLLAALGNGLDANGSRRTSVGTAFGHGNTRLGVSLGNSRDTLPAWLTPGRPGARVEGNDITLVARKDLGSQGYVSLAGTLAKAKLVAPEDMPALADRWNSRSLTLGGGMGAFGASIVGHVVDTPGQPKWEAFGLGLTWRTPWSGQLTVGADNVVTRGKNPFSPNASGEEDGTVPYVRYEQDL
ncbi:MAG TPA: hypothetical protein VLM17_07680 [Xanthomonadaceae bacterium]|nr:hypothetical protein [Xanthomonadaceae bacterium]